MLIDLNSLKSFSTELSLESAIFIDELRHRGSLTDFVANLDKLKEWHSSLGKIEMGRWVHILNDCDKILADATKQMEGGSLFIDQNDSLDRAVISILRFTSLLFENSFSRSVYSSTDHLLKLLDCQKMFIVVQTLRLLLVISKSSRYITQHVPNTDKRLLYMKLTANTECWTGKLRLVKMSECCKEEIPAVDVKTFYFRTDTGFKNFHIDTSIPFAENVTKLKKFTLVDESETILAFNKLRLGYNFDNIGSRLHCIMARLISISVLFYSRCLLDEWRINCLVNDDIIEQIGALLQVEIPNQALLLDAVKTEAMKTLASVVFLEKPRKIQLVVDCLGLNSYHGYTTSLIRACVEKLKAGAIQQNAEYSVAFITALFSLVYHIAGFDYGNESLISCSMIGSLLAVVKSASPPDSQISFVTRAVRIIDILTGIDVVEFNTHDGMTIIVDRFVKETEICKKHVAETNTESQKVCHQQRNALMKSLLNFLKRAITDTNYTAQVRRIMETELPRSIIFIIENPEYFGPSLLHCAIHLITSFIYQEPAQLTFLQDIGLTDALLKSLFDEKFSVSRDIVAGLPNICSAICLNERGLKLFNEVKPLEQIFRIIFSTKFITSLRKRKTEIFESASSLGAAFDELMRHQPTLRKDLLQAFVKVLDEIIEYAKMDIKKCLISWNVGMMTTPEDDAVLQALEPTLDLHGISSPGISRETSPHTASENSLGVTAEKKNIQPQSVFQICHESDATLILSLGDYFGIIGAMLEAILTNRTTQENSLVMLECNIPQRLIKLLTLERRYPTLIQSTFVTNLGNLANIIRHLLSQTNKIDAFSALATNFSMQLKRYETYKQNEQTSHERISLLNRLNCLAFVMCNFLKTALSNVHDIRAPLLEYFNSDKTGQLLLFQFFEVYRNLNYDVIYINLEMKDTNTIPLTITGKQLLRRLDPSTINHANDRAANEGAARLHKQLADIITHLGKIFCSIMSRPKRNFDATIFKYAHNVAEKLFKGVVYVLEFNELMFLSGNLSIYMCHILTTLKKILFDDYQGNFVMLPFFYKAGCHQSFFNFGDFLINYLDNDAYGVAIIAWLSIVQRLVSVNNVISQKNRQDLLRFKIEGFNTKKYLSLCHQDSLVRLQKFFKKAVEIKKDNEKDMLDKIIGTIQVLVRGIVQLNDLEKKENTQPELEVLIHEIDTEKVQRLVEMGFSQSEAVDALLQHTSVPEAAEYLIAMDTSSQNAIRPTVPSTSGSIFSTHNVFNLFGQQSVNTVSTSTESSSSTSERTLEGGAETACPVLTTDYSTITDNTQLPTNVVNDTLGELMDTDQTLTESNLQIETEKKVEKSLTFDDLKNLKTIGFQEAIDYICEHIVPDCILLVQRDSALVFSVAELLSVFMNEPVALEWMKNMFVAKLIADHNKLFEELMKCVEKNEDFSTIEELSNRFSALLHVFCLLWQVLENLRIYTLLNDNFIQNMTSILMLLIEKQSNLRLIPSILLFIDMYEKERRIDMRQKFFIANVEHVQWYYWVADRYGSHNEWRDYTPVCSAILNKAFREGKPSVCLTIGEKNVVVDFVQMLQRQLDGSNVPIGLTSPVYAQGKLKEGFQIEELFKNETLLNTSKDEEKTKKIIQCLVRLLQQNTTQKTDETEQAKPLPLELIYSILSLLFRLISMKNMITPFVEADGIKTLISLKCQERTPLNIFIITLILRTCLDDKETLENAFSSIINLVESGATASLLEMTTRIFFSKTQKNQKEWRRVMHILFPLASKEPQIFQKAMLKNGVVLKNDEINLTKDGNLQKPICGKDSIEILKNIINCLTMELFSNDLKNVNRVLRPSNLLAILSELLRNYASAATILVEMTHRNRSIISWIIDKMMLNADETPDNITAAKSVFSNLVLGPAANRACEIIVNETKTLLCNAITSLAGNKENHKKLYFQISTLARLIMLLRETTQANSNKIRDIKHNYVLIRHIHRKNLVIDFAKCIWHLFLNEKAANETVGAILRLFELVARDLIALNSMRNANATAATASATAAAAIAAATATAAQVQAQTASQAASTAENVSALNNTEHSTIQSITNSLETPENLSELIERVSRERNELLNQNSEVRNESLALPLTQNSENYGGEQLAETAMHDMSVSQVLASIGNIRRGNHQNSSSSSSSSQDSGDSDIDESDSEGSDGEGNILNDEEENSSDDEDEDQDRRQGNSGNVIEIRQHRNLQRELAMDPQVRTSTPISEDELDHQEDIEMHSERVIIGDEDETQRDEEDANDEEEIMDVEEEFEFEDAITDYLDVTYERNNVPQEIRNQHNTAFRLENNGFQSQIVFGGSANLHDFSGVPTLNGLFNDFEILAASAGYVAGILTRFSGDGNGLGGSFAIGVPFNEGLNRHRLITEPMENRYQHPMLRRPQNACLPPHQPNIAAPAAPNNNATTTPVVNAFVPIGDNFQQNQARSMFNEDATLQRMMFGRLSTNRRFQTLSGLRRQGALRRWHPLTTTSSNFFGRDAHRYLTRLFDESLFSELSVFRAQRESSRDLETERRILDASVPYFLDRVSDQIKLLDTYSMYYVGIIVMAYLAKELREPEVKNNLSINVSANDYLPGEETLTAPVTESENNIEMEDNTCPITENERVQQNSINNLNNELMTAQEGRALATETSTLHISSTNREENPDEDGQQSAGESIDSSELSNRLSVLVSGANESEENTRDSTLEALQNNSNVAPISPMEVDHSHQNVVGTSVQENAQPMAVNAPETERETSTNNFQSILGDIEIPEGVDPAFLAALPEDIRQEVIRDHLRQQRAQRINQARQQQAVHATNEGTDATNNQTNQQNTLSNSNEDVLDQEFLAALPPELQEEVLAQHEQRIAQQNRQNAAATENNANIVAPNSGQAAAAVDVDAVFESLPPGLRAQVLADADDSVLQILPPNLLAEANRLRANLEQQQVFRFARMVDRHPRTNDSTIVRFPHINATISNVNGINIEEKGVQMFDKECVATFLLLYFIDYEKCCLKLLKPLCLHSGTCDYIIWGLLSILNVLNNPGDHEANFCNNGWIDSFQTQSALNQSEKTLSVTSDKVKVHQLVRSTVCLRVLDTLVFLARNFPQHFLPNKIRTIPSTTKRWDPVPDINFFWDIVKNINKKTNPEDFKPTVKALTQLRDIIPATLEQSPLAFVLDYTNTDIVKSNNNLMDKTMKILQIIAQSVPSDSQLNEESVNWLTNKLKMLANIILHACFDEGLKDGRMFLIEILRILPSQRANIFGMLYETVKQQGELLYLDINALLTELEESKKSGKFDTEKWKKQRELVYQKPFSESSSNATLQEAMNLSCLEGDYQLKTLKKFTKRNSQPKKFLKALETISYLRNQLRQVEKRKKPVVLSTTTNVPVNVASTNQEQLKTENIQLSASDVPTSSNAPVTSTDPKEIVESDEIKEEKNLENMIEHLQPLWKALSVCLEEMSQLLDSHAVLSLQHAAEAFFLAHAFMFNQKDTDMPHVNVLGTSHNLSETPNTSHSLPTVSTHFRADMNKYTQNMFHFAEKHRTVLNQILRGNTNNLMEDSAFAILTYFPKLLDFDVKRKYFYKEIRKLDDRMRHEDVAVRIRRNHLFSDSFRELFRLKTSDWKSRFYIIFEGEEGQDAGGLLREWYSIITREVFNPNYALFITAPGDRVTYMINKSSYINPEHLDYFKFVGRVIAKAIFDNKQLDCYFTRAFYKHILNVPIRYQDIESEDPSYFSSLEFLLNNPIEELGTDLTFSVEVEEFGVRSMRNLKEEGQKISVTDANKEEYVQLVCQMKMTSSIRKQLDAFLEGFYQIIPKKLISIFNEQELELLISGLPEIDIDDLCNNTEYKSYNRSSPQIQWFWRALRSLEQEDLAKFLQFVTGTSKVPLQGFAHLEGMNGVQKFTIHMDSRSGDRLPSAHTCFNQLDLPKYESYEQLRHMLLLAIRECSEGFAFA